ncbi:MAG: hydrogenase expression/formation protein HypE [Candidatus Edwardsbacteria bacterium]|nr:hydrogenase expression/formation protein HypE [Candidatus Edwardsbacteria bacterium]
MGTRRDKISLAHGSGGRLSHELIERVFRKRFDNELLNQLDDAAEFRIPSLDFARGMTLDDTRGMNTESRIAYTTDSYVVKPLFFPGGDIGKLSVCGTVNDLAMKGARPLYLSAGFIIEEGFALEQMERIVDSMYLAAKEAGVQIVTGDTKVVDKGACDGLFINTSGIGLIPYGVNISGGNAKAGDAVIVSGTIGDHSVAVMNARHNFGLSGELCSDVAPLSNLVQAMLTAGGLHVLRDPTRGGLATTLNEIAGQSKVRIVIEEAKLPVRAQVRGACEMLGLDPLYCANEGKLVAIVESAKSEALVAAMREHPYGKNATIIGTVENGLGVVLKTALGAHRPVLMLEGEALPRIC